MLVRPRIRLINRNPDHQNNCRGSIDTEKYRSLAKTVPTSWNRDQDSHFISSKHTALLLAQDVKSSMDSNGRALDNVIMERLWRSVKYEEVYSVRCLTAEGLTRAKPIPSPFCNHDQLPQALGNATWRPECRRTAPPVCRPLTNKPPTESGLRLTLQRSKFVLLMGAHFGLPLPLSIQLADFPSTKKLEDPFLKSGARKPVISYTGSALLRLLAQTSPHC